jgi:hypothetical protein
VRQLEESSQGAADFVAEERFVDFVEMHLDLNTAIAVTGASQGIAAALGLG